MKNEFRFSFCNGKSIKLSLTTRARGGSRTATTSKMEHSVIIVNGWKHFVIIVNGWKLLTIITKRSMLDVAAVLDPPLIKANACLD